MVENWSATIGKVPWYIAGDGAGVAASNGVSGALSRGPGAGVGRTGRRMIGLPVTVMAGSSTDCAAAGDVPSMIGKVINAIAATRLTAIISPHSKNVII
jgi:hypothetical protein